MLKIAKTMKELSFSALMEVYLEGNRENGKDSYPEEPEGSQLMLAEQDFYNYLTQVFFPTEGAVYLIWEEQGRYAHIMTDYDTLYSPELKGYEYVFSNTQLKLNGIPVSSYTVYKNDVYTIYSIPVIYDKKIYSLRVLKTEKDDMAEFEVMGLWSGINPTTGVMARSIKNVGVGDVIEPIYRVYGTQTDEYIKGKRLKIVFGGLNVSERPVEDGEYIVSYTTEDAYGVRTETETTDVTALKGKLKISN